MLDQNALAKSAYQLQPLPPSLNRVASLVAGEEPDLRAIVEVISFDPVITGKLLHVANSAYSAARVRVSTVKEAVVRLGSGCILRLIVGTCARPLLERAIPAYGLSKGELWRHSTATALAAESLSGYCTAVIPPASFTAALLHDLGKLILAKQLTPDLTEVLQRAVEEGGFALCQAETELLSVHHGEVGGLIAQHWKLPPAIIEGITYHHTPESGETVIPYIVQVSDAVAHRITGDWDEEMLERHHLPATWDRLGMREEDFTELCERVAKRFEMVKDHFQ